VRLTIPCGCNRNAGVAPAGGTGIWNTAGLNWTSDAGATYIAWPNTDPNLDTAIFGGNRGKGEPGQCHIRQLAQRSTPQVT